jgi:hypothetical protein
MLKALNAELADYYTSGDKEALQNWKEKQSAINTLIGFQTRLEAERMGNLEDWNEAKLKAVTEAAKIAAKAANTEDSDRKAARRAVDAAVAKANMDASQGRSGSTDQEIAQNAGNILGSSLLGAYGDPLHNAHLIMEEANKRNISVSASAEEKAQALAAFSQKKQQGQDEADRYSGLANAAIAAQGQPSGSPLYRQLQTQIDEIRPLKEESPISEEALADMVELESQRDAVKERLGLNPQGVDTGPSKDEQEQFIAWAKARGYNIGSYQGTRWVPGKDAGDALIAYERQQGGKATPFMRGKPSGETEFVRYVMPNEHRSKFFAGEDETLYQQKPNGEVLAYSPGSTTPKIVRTADGLYPNASLRASYEGADPKTARTFDSFNDPKDPSKGTHETTAQDFIDLNFVPVDTTYGEFHGFRQPPMAYDDINMRRYKNPDGTEVIFRLSEKGEWVPDRTPPLPSTFDIGQNKIAKQAGFDLGKSFRSLRKEKHPQPVGRITPVEEIPSPNPPKPLPPMKEVAVTVEPPVVEPVKEKKERGTPVADLFRAIADKRKAPPVNQAEEDRKAKEAMAARMAPPSATLPPAKRTAGPVMSTPSRQELAEEATVQPVESPKARLLAALLKRRVTK